jgi:hypothetical protein
MNDRCEDVEGGEGLVGVIIIENTVGKYKKRYFDT